VKSRRRRYSTIPRPTCRRSLAATLPPPTLFASGPLPALGSGAGNSSLSGNHLISPPGDAAGGIGFEGPGGFGGGGAPASHGRADHRDDQPRLGARLRGSPPARALVVRDPDGHALRLVER
jgi:hypothetical protein